MCPVCMYASERAPVHKERTCIVRSFFIILGRQQHVFYALWSYTLRSCVRERTITSLIGSLNSFRMLRFGNFRRRCCVVVAVTELVTTGWYCVVFTLARLFYIFHIYVRYILPVWCLLQENVRITRVFSHDCARWLSGMEI